MKKFNIMFTLGAVLIGFLAPLNVIAAEKQDSVCVVTVSFDRESEKILFSAKNGFVDPAIGHPEQYLFTNCKYIQFVKGDNITDTDKVSYDKNNKEKIENIRYLGKKFQNITVRNYMEFKDKFYITPNGKEGSCQVKGQRLIIRQSHSMDSLFVTLSYKYGKEESIKDSTYTRKLPIESKHDIQIYEDAFEVKLKVERKAFGKVQEVAINDTTLYESKDNYFGVSNYDNTIQSDVKEIVIKTSVITPDYKELQKSLVINVERIKQPVEKDFKLSKFLKEYWWILLIIISAILYAVYRFTPKHVRKNGKKNDKKTDSRPTTLTSAPDTEPISKKEPAKPVAPVAITVSSPVTDVLPDVDRKQLERLTLFVKRVMEIVSIDAKKVLETEGDVFDAELKSVMTKLRRDRDMFAMVDKFFTDEYDQNSGESKLVSYEKKIKHLCNASAELSEIMTYLGVSEAPKALSVIKEEHGLIGSFCNSLKAEKKDLITRLNKIVVGYNSYNKLKTKITSVFKFDEVTEPELLVEKAAERIGEYNNIVEHNSDLNKRVETLEEYEKKYHATAVVHEINRNFYLEKLNNALSLLDGSLQRISANVLSSSQPADMVRSIYSSTGGFKSFYDFISNEDWTKYDKLTEIRDVLSNRLESSIAFDRSWVNGVARFYAYLRVPQLEAHLASSGISKADFDVAYNAMSDLYTMLGDYTELILPYLFVDVYNPDIHNYDDQAFGNVISAICSEYDSFRSISSALADINKLGYKKSDGTYVKPEVIF